MTNSASGPGRYVDAPARSAAAAEARAAVWACCEAASASRAGRALTEAGGPPWTVTLLHRLEDAEVRCPEYDRLYPVNALRNAALAAARAELVLLLDVDFVPSAGLYPALAGSPGLLREALGGGSGPLRGPARALVVPAFEVHGGRGRARALARSGDAVRAACRAGEAEGFHVSHFPRGHSATDFERWLRGPALGADVCGPAGRLSSRSHGVDGYRAAYEEYFEPYVVAARRLVPAYDERFRGYGLNKISHLYEMSARGFEFYVAEHPDAFVVAEEHPKSSSWSSVYGTGVSFQPRARIAVHYSRFKAELQQQLSRESSAKGPTPGAGLLEQAEESALGRANGVKGRAACIDAASTEASGSDSDGTCASAAA
ncbi:unnamed protein product [Prorocentrum cordatum]|uniref:Uncharacterized protein n=1 Tax=Prorocentrum cordatum TaxID=2364126 RepID=A0ABN9XFQ2_9DINO|nr:unnamed protein product [Polarella glacialis]